jgi:hypothetical protein
MTNEQEKLVKHAAPLLRTFLALGFLLISGRAQDSAQNAKIEELVRVSNAWRDVSADVRPDARYGG